MLKVPDHQVAGHRAITGALGPLTDDSGHFYKPLQGDERGSQEEDFYMSFSANTEIPDLIRRFFPVFHGTRLVQASDGRGLHPHLELQDVVFGRVNASIVDIKIGSRTWYPQSSDDYIQKCLIRDRETTSSTLGFRISGLQVYESKQSGYWRPAKELVTQLNVDGVREVLSKFVSNSNPSNVYGHEILAQLLELKGWLENQTMYHFNSCSLLLLYDEEVESSVLNSRAQVKLIDFAHAVDGNGVIDHNFLGGLCSLINFISQILTQYENGAESNGNGSCEMMFSSLLCI